MDRKEPYIYKSRLQEISPSTRFGQGFFDFQNLKFFLSNILFSISIAFSFKTTQKTR